MKRTLRIQEFLRGRCVSALDIIVYITITINIFILHILGVKPSYCLVLLSSSKMDIITLLCFVPYGVGKSGGPTSVPVFYLPFISFLALNLSAKQYILRV